MIRELLNRFAQPKPRYVLTDKILDAIVVDAFRGVRPHPETVRQMAYNLQRVTAERDEVKSEAAAARGRLANYVQGEPQLEHALLERAATAAQAVCQAEHRRALGRRVAKAIMALGSPADGQ